MSQCGQMRKKWAFQGYAKIVLRLHTARTENPDIPKIHPSASHSKITTRIHPDALHNTPHAPPRHLQRTQCANRQQQTPTDTKRRLQTPQDTDRCCLSVYGGVCWHLLSSVSILCSLDIFDGCLRGVSWVCVGI